MHNSFTQQVLTTVFLGFAAACLLWMMRHVVEPAFDETGAGWHKMFDKPAKTQTHKW